MERTEQETTLEEGHDSEGHPCWDSSLLGEVLPVEDFHAS